MRIVSLNTWKGEGAYRRRLDQLTAGLHALAPDVVCLQESLQTGDKDLDTAGHLARRLNLHLAWAPARLKRRRVENRWRECYSGLAILSRAPIQRHRLIALPFHPQDPDRQAHWVDIRLSDVEQRVVNLHLTHISGADGVRRDQLRTIMTGLAQANGPNYVWICGDFNAAPENASMRVLEEQSTWMVVDAYIAGGGRLPGATFPVERIRSEGRRIDRIFLLTRNQVPAPIILQATKVMTVPDAGGAYPSDHAGVMVATDMKSTAYEKLIDH